MTAHLKNMLREDAGVPGFARPQARRTVGYYEACGKRLLDLCLVIATAPITVPLILIMALAIARHGGNPFYWQRRIGRGGKTFRLLKLRTMVPNAEATLESYLAAHPEARREWDLTQKLKQDPRITLVGRCLRKTSMDELPQIWNVLRGEMSMVGPRPMMEDQARLYPGNAYFQIRPGITGLWQVMDRNNTAFRARAGYDTRYFNMISLGTDLWILARTVLVVLRGTGY